MKRRTLLLGAAGGGTALVVGWLAMPQRSRLGSPGLWPQEGAGVALNGWIRIDGDGRVALAMPRSEMGQGVHTALAMLAAEELDVPLDRVRIAPAGGDALFGNVAMLQGGLPFHPLHDESEDGFGRAKAARWVVGKLARELGINATGGSSSVADAWEPVRMAAATARASLLGAAALQWKLPVDELVVQAGVVRHAASGHSARYGELAQVAAATPPGAVRLKARKDWTLLGTAAPRLDVPSKVDGSARFGIDARPQGLKFAVVKLSPDLAGTPGRLDADAALKLPGVERVVRLPAYAGTAGGFAVIGRTSWHAMRGVAAVDVDWPVPPGERPDSVAIRRQLSQAAASGEGADVFFTRGDASRALREGGQVVEAEYAAPHLAHMAMEPMNCTAQVTQGRVTVWAPTQVPGMARDIAARVAGVDPDDVTLHVTLLGGGFGRRLEVDYVAMAVRVALDAGGAPVQVLWPREEDTTHDFYRPMHVARMRAAMDGGQVKALEIVSAGDAISPRWLERAMPSLAGPVDMPDKTTSEGLFDIPYGVTHQRMAHVPTRTGVPVGFWRSVGHSHNAFFSEGFIDELAVAAKQDGVQFRRGLLEGAPRYRAVLDLAAQKAGWGQPLAAGRARGVALHESFGSIVAQVVEVSLEKEGPRVHRVTCAIDCGTVINPGVVAQQMESSVLFALSAALHGGIDIVQGRVQQRSYPDQPLVTLKEAPTVQTWVVPSERPPQGVGEPGVPPLAPALASALHALTGQRLRELPLRLSSTSIGQSGKPVL